MTKARDISSLIGSSGQIENDKITLDANEIPNLDTSKITTGTFADARISNSSVVQHSTPFDDNKIVNDISTLALRQASDQNKSAYNTNSQSVDVFQDDTGIDTTTNASRNANEYVSSTVDSTPASVKILIQGNDASLTESITGATPTLVGSAGQATSTKKFGTGSVGFPSAGSKVLYGSNLTSANVAYNQDFSMDCWLYHSNSFATEAPILTVGRWYYAGENGTLMVRIDENNLQKITLNFHDGTSAQYFWSSYTTVIPNNQWFHFALARQSGSIYVWVNGSQANPSSTSGTNPQNEITFSQFNLGWGEQQNQSFDGYIDDFRWSTGTNLFGTGSSITVPSSEINYLTTSATGNFTGTTITAPSSVSEMGAIITYQDQSGTNALNTDIVLQLSADGGSNYSTATLTALPDFSTGIKMAKVNDLSVTAGTSLKYKISFANQASGSKEARIRGVALQY